MISVFIICKNEERIIEACLKQASKLAAEIIVVDSGSTDRTLEIVAKYTDRVHHQDWLGYGAQKNYALSLCSHDWVLSLDADEVLSDMLITEINALDFHDDAYKIARKLLVGDKWLRWGGYYPDYQLRLFKKSLGKFSELPVHESVELQSELISKLKHPLDHHAYKNLDEMENAFMKFAQLSGKKASFLVRLFKAGFIFFNKFFLQLGFMDGLLGLRLAWLQLRYCFNKYK